LFCNFETIYKPKKKKKGKVDTTLYKTLGDQKLKNKKTKQTKITTMGYNELEF
jgi:hypothetical protein